MHEQRTASPLDRFLRLFTDTRPGEAPTALLLTLNVFLILSAYYVLKVVRETLILTQFGAEAKAYTAAGQVLLLAILVPLYGTLAGRVPRRRLVNIVTALFVACLGVFYVLVRLGVSTGIVFFLWVGVFNVMIIAQAWAFANDVYTNDEGKRLFPLIGFGATSGGVFGSYIPRLLPDLSIVQLFLLAAVLLGLAVVITNLVDARERRRTEAHVPDVKTSGFMPAATGQFRTDAGEFKEPGEEYQQESGVFKIVKSGAGEEKAKPISTGGAFQLVFRNRYLLQIALLIMLLNWVNTTGEFILGKTVERAAAEAISQAAAGTLTQEQFVRDFYSSFFLVVNLVGLVVQLLLVSRIIKFVGIRFALLILPAIAFAGYMLLAFIPILGVVRWVKTAENATDYSLNNTVRHALFLPTTREEKYKGKQVIEGFFWRTGDVLSALLVFVGTSFLLFETKHFAMFNLALVAIWLGLAYLVGRRHARLTAVTGS